MSLLNPMDDDQLDAIIEGLERIKSLEGEVERLRAAATALYGHRWVCDELKPGEQATLWESLRDALGIAPGTATAAGVGAKPQPTLTDAERVAIYRASQYLSQNDVFDGMADDAATLRGLLERLGGGR